VHLSSLTELWDSILGPQPHPPGLLVAVTAVLALGSVATYQTWRVSRHIITIAHEGGHALMALLTGRRLSGIRLHSDTSGLTVSKGKPSGPGMMLTGFAGYVTPSLLGLAGGWLLAADRITLLLWACLILLPLMLIMIRNVFGVVSIVITTAVVFVVSWFATPAVQSAFAYLGVWFLLLGGMRPIFELQKMRRRRQAPDSDADQLAGLTGVPGLIWVGVFGVINLAALALGTWLVLRGAGIDLASLDLGSFRLRSLRADSATP
jgi:hypothetical protein